MFRSRQALPPRQRREGELPRALFSALGRRTECSEAMTGFHQAKRSWPSSGPSGHLLPKGRRRRKPHRLAKLFPALDGQSRRKAEPVALAPSRKRRRAARSRNKFLIRSATARHLCALNPNDPRCSFQQKANDSRPGTGKRGFPVAQPQLCDCALFVANDRHAVKAYFPIFPDFR